MEDVIEFDRSPKRLTRRHQGSGKPELVAMNPLTISSDHVFREETTSSSPPPSPPPSPARSPSPRTSSIASNDTIEGPKTLRSKKDPSELLHLLRRKRTTSGSSDDDTTSHNTTHSLHSSQDTSPSGLPIIGKIPFTPLSKSGGPKTGARSGTRTWSGDQLIDGKYDVTEKDKSVLERIAHRAQRHGTRVRRAHEVFVELEELKADGDGLEWEETARWIKFEEDVEGRGWGRPHISALTFHSLAALRKTLETGCVLLDVEGDDFPSIVKEIVRELVISEMLPLDCVEPVTQVLYKRHKHAANTTLWKKLKKATSREESSSRGGRINLRGEEEERVWLEEEEEDSKEEEEDGKERPGILRTGPNSSQSMTSSASQKSTNKKVVFNVSSGTSIQSGGGSGAAVSITLNGEQISPDQVQVPNPPLAQTHHHNHHTGSDFFRNLLDERVMDKIPEGAESLTVLVGGVKFLSEPVVAFVRLAQSHLLGDLTEVPVPVRFIYFLLGPHDSELDYHEVGRSMATLMSDKHFHEVAYSALMADDLLDGIDVFLDDSIVLPPGDWDQNLLLPVMHQRNELRKRKESKIIEHERREMLSVDPMRHSRRCCGGIWSDVKKMVKRYPSDIRDMFHIQTFVSLIFLFVTFLAPAVAFGGLMEEVTGNLIGETETLLMTGLSGVLYGLAACQPLTIVAFTGPLLLFEEVVFAFSQQVDIPYLEWRAAIGVWLMLILAFMAVSEITTLVTRFSRFSEEIFTGIIAIFFTYEAVKSIQGVFKRNPLCSIEDYPCTKYDDSCFARYYDNSSSNYSSSNSSSTVSCVFPSGGGLSDVLPSGFRVCNQPNTALWSMILCLCTFFITFLLTKLRKGKFLGKRIRRIFSDFSMFVAIFTMLVVAYTLRDKIAVETLVVPARFQPSCPSRAKLGWIINPFTSERMETWMYFAAIIPAALLAILTFIENQLALILVNKAEHKLQKEVGYHYDLILVALLNGLAGVAGMPWVCAASVRSIQHVQALSVYKAHNAPGEKPKLLRVYEQRMTNVVVHFFILLTPLAYQGLRLIPIPVVLGVFFYLTYSSLSGVQLTTRIKLLFTPPKHHPDLYYVRKVRTIRMHLYTIIQVILVSLLWTLKLSPAGMVYPVAIVGLVPIRWFLRRFVFSHTEMEALDSEEDYPEDEEERNDFDIHVPY